MKKFSRKKAVILVLLTFLIFYVGFGAVLFWGKQTYPPKSVHLSSGISDIVFVFEGAGERIKPAFNLVLQHKAKVIVISPASESRMRAFAKRYAGGASVPYILETQATSTHENAFYCAGIVKREKARNVILITSSYHLERSYRLFTLALRGYPVKISCMPVYPYGINDPEVLHRLPYFRALSRIERFNTVFNYIKFLENGYRIKKCSRFEHFLEEMYGFYIKRELNRYEANRIFQAP
jgi:uncharacterized SAM-binding protein YcdF (DUF218 family)